MSGQITGTVPDYVDAAMQKLKQNGRVTIGQFGEPFVPGKSSIVYKSIEFDISDPVAAAAFSDSITECNAQDLQAYLGNGKR
jgi:hypothetical protein